MYSCSIKLDMKRNLKGNAHKKLSLKQVNN